MPTLKPEAADTRVWLAAWLRGELLGAPGETGMPEVQSLLEAAAREGVAALCWHRLARQPQAGFPEALTRAWRIAHQREVALDLLREEELRVVLQRLADAGLRPLLLKGAGLAYTHYPQPHLRARCDTDLLLPDRDAADLAWAVLEDFGYERQATVTGRFISQEFACHRRDRSGLAHTLDIHWEPSNAVIFRGKLTFEALDQAAQPVPPLGATARTLAPVQALLLALMHRIQHQPQGSSNRLIWLYDIHLLALGYTETEWTRFLRLAVDNGLSGIALDGLEATRRHFNTVLPAAIILALRDAARTERLSPNFRTGRYRALWQDLRALSDGPSRIRLLREHLLPDPRYLRVKYPDCPDWPLPLLYLRRLVERMHK